ncbi:MAG TPA: thioredoxin domain-containing protein, partial [Sphingomonadales bacterium]|nr:thioredoxin domain-containing protein [Sphingomonadales bacterium]
AKRQNKPILLSVGYAACHWCHVMAHESFEDKETAALMNALYVNIKLDREERPELDVIYQKALAFMGEQGGWPLTMFLTPQAEPFWGGTYFPKEPLYGRPDFKTVLRQVHATYMDKPAAVKKNVDLLTAALKRSAALSQPEDMDLQVFTGAARLVCSYMDLEWGGTQGAPKFPNAPQLELLWRAHIRGQGNEFGEAVLVTLHALCQGGIYDHLGGGFCRYATDARWLVPHFEKMLYDNAMLLRLLAEAFAETRNPLFKARTEETVAWLAREMRNSGGAFAAALDADSEGEEGKFYVWAFAEIEKALGKDAPAFCETYGATPEGNWEGKNVLHRLHPAGGFSPDVEAGLKASRERLFAARSARTRPLCDDKVLADWNGLAIAALARAAQVFDRPDWLSLAKEAFAFVAGTMTQQGGLAHSFRAGKTGAPAFLDDYAFMVAAALALHQAAFEERYLRQAEAWMAEAENNLSTAPFSGFYQARESKDVIVRVQTVDAHPAPAGNGVMIENYAALFRLTGKTAYRKNAEALVRAFAHDARRNPFSAAAYFCGYDSHVNGIHAAIKAEGGKEKDFLSATRKISLPGLTVSLAGEGAGGDPALEKAVAALKEGQALACKGSACSTPQGDAAKLRETLAALRRA